MRQTSTWPVPAAALCCSQALEGALCWSSAEFAGAGRLTVHDSQQRPAWPPPGRLPGCAWPLLHHRRPADLQLRLVSCLGCSGWYGDPDACLCVESAQSALRGDEGRAKGPQVCPWPEPAFWTSKQTWELMCGPGLSPERWWPHQRRDWSKAGSKMKTTGAADVEEERAPSAPDHAIGFASNAEEQLQCWAYRLCTVLGSRKLAPPL